MAWLTQLRFAFRSLTRAPLSTTLGALSLSIGLAAAITAASLAEALLLAPLPGVAAGRDLVALAVTDAAGERASGLSHPAFLRLQGATRTLTGVAALSDHVLALRAEGEAEALLGQAVSASYFAVLGAKPAAGRFFLPHEDTSPGAHPVVVISHSYWQRRFGGDPATVGRRVSINGSPFTVVGIAGPGFRGAFRGFRFDVWTPLAMAEVVEPRERLDDESATWLEIIGRRAPGATREQVAAELGALAPRLADPTARERRAIGFRSQSFSVRPMTGLDDELRVGAIGLVAVLMSVAALVLGVACANLANLQLVRALGRGRELAVRQAVGAGRLQVLGQLLIESLALGLLGGAGGLLLAAWAGEALSLFQPPPPFAVDLHLALGPRVLAFSLLVSLAAGLAVGLGPALEASRLSFSAVLRAAAGAGRRQARLRGALVVAQVAVSLVLLVAAGLLLRTLANAARIDPGFDPEGVEVALLDASLLHLGDGEARELFGQLVEAAEALPGVERVSLVDRPPLALGGPSRREVSVPGHLTVLGPAAGEEAPRIAASVVGPGYFELMRTPLLEGRGFEDADREGTAAVAVVNQEMAARFWRGASAVGRSFVLDGRTVTIVGVAGDGKYGSLGEAPRPFFYLPFAQQPRPRMHLLVRRATAAEVGPALAALVERLEPDLPIVLSTPLRRLIGLSLLPQRIAGAAAGVLGAVGLLLASLGVYGSVASTVRQRRREIGIHLALGAQRREVVGLVMREGMVLAALGVLVGALAASGVLRLARGLLFGIGAGDPLTYAAVATLLGVATLAASYLPARRAAAIDPISTLRTE